MAAWLATSAAWDLYLADSGHRERRAGHVRRPPHQAQKLKQVRRATNFVV